MTDDARSFGASVTIVVESEPDDATTMVIDSGLDDFNDSIAPCDNHSAFWVVARDPRGAVCGGLHAVTLFDWLFIRALWVSEASRRQGVASRLLFEAEAVARERSCSGSYLDTFSFQAPGFYERHGYKEFGRLVGLPPGHARIWLSKPL